jgi:hypothetical protein
MIGHQVTGTTCRRVGVLVAADYVKPSRDRPFHMRAGRVMGIPEKPFGREVVVDHQEIATGFQRGLQSV